MNICLVNLHVAYLVYLHTVLVDWENIFNEYIKHANVTGKCKLAVLVD